MRGLILVIIVSIIYVPGVATADEPVTTIEAYMCIGEPTPPDRVRVFESKMMPSAAVGSMSFERCDVKLDVDLDIASRTNGVLANSKQWLEIYFYKIDQVGNRILISPDAAQFRNIQVSSGNVLVFKAEAYGTTVDVPLDGLGSLSHLSLVKAVVTYNGGNGKSTGYFRLFKRFSGYGIAGRETFVWMPLGLFGTAFEKNDNGYAFSAFPVGLAAGGRMDVGGKFYLGLSAMVNYTVFRKPERSGAMSSSEVSLSGGAVGALLDVNNLVYVGYGYVFDWTRDASNPGHSLVIGAGPGLIQYLQGKK